MSTPLFPALAGIGWNIPKTVEWSTTVQTARSGKETRIGNWTYPVYHWELVFDFLRAAPANPELQQLTALFNGAGAQVGNFLYTDPDDNAATAQEIGVGDGVTTAFQLVRSFGGYVEPIWAPNVVSSITVAGVPATGWTVSNFDGASPGLVTFAAAPAPGAAIVASFSFYFPCRFEDDRLTAKLLLAALYSADKVRIKSVK